MQHINAANATDSVMIDGKNYTYDVYDQCYLQQWYPGQVGAFSSWNGHLITSCCIFQGLIEQILLLLAVIAIPVMLLVKPFYVRSLHNRGLPLPGGHSHGDGDEEVLHFSLLASNSLSVSCFEER